MTTPDLSPEISTMGYVIAQSVLRQTIDEAGGFHGVYDEFRSDHTAALDKYRPLLDVSVASDEQQRNEEAFMQNCSGQTVREQNLQRITEIAQQQGLSFHDAMAFYMALNIVRSSRRILG